jgi:hypothetical protein
MELLDLISRVFMITSMICMTIYFVRQGLNAINRATEPENDISEIENQIYETVEDMDYDQAVTWYVMQRAKEDSEVHCD